MPNKIVIGKYYNINSVIHNMNSFIKILCTLIFSILCFISFDLKLNLFVFVFLVLFILLSNVPLKLYLKNILCLKWFLLFILIINVVFQNDFYSAFILVFKVISLIIYTMMVLYTTSHDELVIGLNILFYPLKLFKVPINKMSHSIVLSLKFIPVFILQYERIIKSQNNKGIYYVNLNLKEKFEVLTSIVISMFITGIKKSDILAESMEIRLFDYNCYNNKLKFCYFDIFALLLHISLFVLSIKESVII